MKLYCCSVIPEGLREAMIWLRAHRHLYLDASFNRKSQADLSFFSFDLSFFSFLRYHFLIEQGKGRCLGALLLPLPCLTSVCTALRPVPEQFKGLFPSPNIYPLALGRSRGMAGKCQALYGEREVVSEDRAGFFFPWGTRAAGRENTQETGVGRVHLAWAEPSFQQKLCVPDCWGLVCTASQMRGLHLSKPRQSLTFLAERNLNSPQAGAFLWT